MNALKIFIFTILVAAFYSYVGQMVPQKVTYPPEESEISEDMTPTELATVGEEIVGAKGTCLTCHTIGESGTLRFPDLAGIGARASTRIEGYSDVEYLAESLYEPNAYIVEGFLGGMPAISSPPISLSDDEILAVIAYLQSLGGEATVTLDTELRWQGQTPEPPATQAAAAPAAGTAGEPRSGEELFELYLCNTCHRIDQAGQLVGPSLYDAGTRLSKAELYESLLEPDATVAEGYNPGIMSATLNGVGFPEAISTAELQNLVDYLAAQEGE